VHPVSSSSCRGTPSRHLLRRHRRTVSTGANVVQRNRIAEELNTTGANNYLF
jgi:hypothetical protein